MLKATLRSLRSYWSPNSVLLQCGSYENKNDWLSIKKLSNKKKKKNPISENNIVAYKLYPHSFLTHKCVPSPKNIESGCNSHPVSNCLHLPIA